ncbi:MAG TPA: DUF3592 domain-containing protein [Marinagarivorans sp.]
MTTRKTQTTRGKKSIYTALFGIPFAAIGLGFLFFSVLPSLYEWHTMKHWPAVPAQVLSAELKSHQSDDGTSWEAKARYQYRYNHLRYTSSRIGIMTGADNIGDWQQTMAQRLKAHLRDKKPLTVYVNPQAPEQAIVDRQLRWGLVLFKLLFAVVFSGFGLTILVLGFMSQKNASTAASTGDAPWLANAKWRNPISSSAKTAVWALWGFCIFWNLLSLPVTAVVPSELKAQNYIILVALLFPAAGVGMVVWALVLTARWRRFGPAPLTLSPYPAPIGGTMAGKIDLAQRLPQNAFVEVTLSCVRSYYRGTGKNRRRSEQLIWSKTGAAQVAIASGGSVLTFRFNTPSDLPESELACDDYHFWRLRVYTKLPGADLDRSYEIPAFNGDTLGKYNASTQNAFNEAHGHQNVSSAGADSTQHPTLKQARADALEALLNVRTINGGIEINLKALRHAKTSSFIIALGLVCTGVGVAIRHHDAPILGPLIALVGAAVLLGGLYSLLNSYRVQITRTGINTERKLLGITLKQTATPRSDISHLCLRSTGTLQSGQHHVAYFAVDAQRNAGKAITLAESLAGQTLAEDALESIALLTGYPTQ